MKQIHLFIQGDVIGVGFRAWTKIQAKIVGVTGWVKNAGDQVEVVIQGDEESVKKALSHVRRGPPISRVDRVDIVEEEIKKTFDEFEIRS